MCWMVRRASKIRSSFDRPPKSETSFDVAVVVPVDGDDAAKNEKIGNRSTKTRPDPIPGARLGIRARVVQEPMRGISPKENDKYGAADNDEQQPGEESSFHVFTPDLSFELYSRSSWIPD